MFSTRPRVFHTTRFPHPAFSTPRGFHQTPRFPQPVPRDPVPRTPGPRTPAPRFPPSPGVFVTASAWMDGTAIIPVSSRACKPWHEWLVCYFINDAEATNIVVLSKVSRIYGGISCRLPLRSLLFNEINPLLSTFPCFQFRAFLVENRSCV